MREKLLHYLKPNKINQVENVYSIVETLPIGERIPKIVHHTYPSKNLTPELAQNLDTLKQNNPDWMFCFYDDEDQITFIKSHFPYLLEYYLSIDADYGAAKADFFRYLLIYKLGGVYLDIKSYVSKPLSEIVTDQTKYLLAYWENPIDGKHDELSDPKGEFEQWHVISVAGHPFLKSVIDSVCRNIRVYNPFFDGKGAMATLKVTGPIAYSIAIAPHINQHPHTLSTDAELGLMYSIYNQNQATKLAHRKIFKSHYSRSTKPLIKQHPVITFSYILLCRIFGKITRTWHMICNTQKQGG